MVVLQWMFWVSVILAIWGIWVCYGYLKLWSSSSYKYYQYYNSRYGVKFHAAPYCFFYTIVCIVMSVVLFIKM